MKKVPTVPSVEQNETLAVGWNPSTARSRVPHWTTTPDEPDADASPRMTMGLCTSIVQAPKTTPGFSMKKVSRLAGAAGAALQKVIALEVLFWIVTPLLRRAAVAVAGSNRMRRPSAVGSAGRLLTDVTTEHDKVVPAPFTVQEPSTLGPASLVIAPLLILSSVEFEKSDVPRMRICT